MISCLPDRVCTASMRLTFARLKESSTRCSFSNTEFDASISQSLLLHGSQGAAVRTNDLGISAQTA